MLFRGVLTWLVAGLQEYMANIFLIYSLNICDSGAPAVSNTVGQAKARNDMRTCFSFCKLGTEKLSLVPLRNNSCNSLNFSRFYKNNGSDFWYERHSLVGH